MSVPEMNIGRRRIGAEAPCFIIAEAGVNHNGDLVLGKQLIDIAAASGADAVKFQTFKADRLATTTAPKAEYQKATTDNTQSQHEMLRALEIGGAMQSALIDHCRTRGILFLSTPFDEESTDELESADVPAFKVSSGDLTNLSLLEHIARKGRPMIISTGMAFIGEVETAVRTIEATAGIPIAILHCTTNYPADPSEVNLRAMNTLAQAFEYPVGYSDHTNGIEVSAAAVALGARIIEKHFTVDRTLPGPDHRASLEPDELRAMVDAIRNVERAMGSARKQPSPAEVATAAVARRSVVAARDIPAGAVIDATMLTLMRPGTGLSPSLRSQIVGRVAKRAIERGQLLSWEMLG